MNLSRNRIMWWASLLTLLVVFAPAISADDDDRVSIPR